MFPINFSALQVKEENGRASSKTMMLVSKENLSSAVNPTKL